MKKQNNENKKKDYDYTFIQFSLSKQQKQKVKEKINESHFSTMSDFVREAIQDKIRRIENPKVFENKELSSKQFKSILENISNNSKKIDLLIEKTDTIMKIQDSLDKLKTMVNRPKYKELEVKIIDLLRKKNKLRPKEISKELDIEVEKVYDIVSNDNIFELDIKTGRFGLENE